MTSNWWKWHFHSQSFPDTHLFDKCYFWPSHWLKKMPEELGKELWRPVVHWLFDQYHPLTDCTGCVVYYCILLVHRSVWKPVIDENGQVIDQKKMLDASCTLFHLIVWSVSSIHWLYCACCLVLYPSLVLEVWGTVFQSSQQTCLCTTGFNQDATSVMWSWN